jgi:hypothetical protein
MSVESPFLAKRMILKETSQLDVTLSISLGDTAMIIIQFPTIVPLSEKRSLDPAG